MAAVLPRLGACCTQCRPMRAALRLAELRIFSRGAYLQGPPSWELRARCHPLLDAEQGALPTRDRAAVCGLGPPQLPPLRLAD